MHERCAADARVEATGGTRSEWDHLGEGDGREAGGWGTQERRLPVMADVFRVRGFTREFTHRGLRALYRQEYRRLCLRVVAYNREDAWDHMSSSGGGREVADTMEMKRCRVAHTELAMFPKAVLMPEKRGVRAGQNYARAKNRLDWWMQGGKGEFVGRGQSQCL